VIGRCDANCKKVMKWSQPRVGLFVCCVGGWQKGGMEGYEKNRVFVENLECFRIPRMLESAA